MRPQATQPVDKNDLVCASDIARSIKRSRPSVVDTIARLGLLPVITLKGVRWYHRDCISPIQSAMRAPNKTKLAKN